MPALAAAMEALLAAEVDPPAPALPLALALAVPPADPEAVALALELGAGIALPLTPFRLGKTPLPPAPVAVVLTAEMGPGLAVSKYPLEVKFRYGAELEETFWFWYPVTFETIWKTLEYVGLTSFLPRWYNPQLFWTVLRHE
jgi:hypothetical protein